MLKLAFKNCCMTCGNVDVDYDYAVDVMGEKTVCVYCSHMKVCEQYKNEKESDKRA